MHPAVQSTIHFVKQDMAGVCSAHDWYHIERVWKNAQKIYASEQQGDLLVIELGALLHETFDEKFFADDAMHERKHYISNFLDTLELNTQQKSSILFIINNVGFGKAMERDPNMILTIEMQIVEDADRLEAVGAIAIARTFAYGGQKGRAIYDPSIPYRTTITRENYRDPSGTGINHFYEKLLLLKDMMHTQTAKSISEQRHNYMEGFLQQFFAERNGEI